MTRYTKSHFRSTSSSSSEISNQTLSSNHCIPTQAEVHPITPFPLKGHYSYTHVCQVCLCAQADKELQRHHWLQLKLPLLLSDEQLAKLFEKTYLKPNSLLIF